MSVEAAEKQAPQGYLSQYYVSLTAPFLFLSTSYITSLTQQRLLHARRTAFFCGRNTEYAHWRMCGRCAYVISTGDDAWLQYRLWRTTRLLPQCHYGNRQWRRRRRRAIGNSERSWRWGSTHATSTHGIARNTHRDCIWQKASITSLSDGPPVLPLISSVCTFSSSSCSSVNAQRTNRFND